MLAARHVGTDSQVRFPALGAYKPVLSEQDAQDSNKERKKGQNVPAKRRHDRESTRAHGKQHKRRLQPELG
jgi:hypothetical protein